MKKILSILCLLFFVSNAFAGSVFIKPGAKATGMGGAFVAVADDATAIYWNPAGLVQLECGGVEASAYYVKKAATVSLGDMSMRFRTKAFLPFIGGYKKLDDTTAIGAGIYCSGGGGGKWDYPMLGTVDACYGFMVFNLSGAKAVSDVLDIGVGINVVKMKFDLKADIFIEEMVDIDADGQAIEGVIGALYKPNDEFRLGLTCKTGTNIKVKGKFKGQDYSHPSPLLETDVTMKYAYPFSIALGSAYNLTECLTLSGQVTYFKFSDLKNDIDYKNNNIPDVNESMDWDDTYVIGLGANYKANDNWSVQAGIEREPSPMPKDQTDLFNVDQYSYTTLTVGTEYNTEKFKVNFSYGYSMSDDLKAKLFDIEGADYEYTPHSFRLGAGYKC
ncbi:OmpP1/FadL family transporter [bacterium]